MANADLSGGGASVRVRMKVDGGDKLARKLQMLATETAKKHMRECALAGAEVIRTEIEAKAPRKTGTLAGDIQKEVEKQTKARVQVKIGPGDKGWYGHFVEDGHPIIVGKRTVGHAPPHPFMRPAFDAKDEEAQKAFEEELRRRLRL